MADGGRMGLRKHTVHGLVEFDITQARVKPFADIKRKRAKLYPFRRSFWPAWDKRSMRTNKCTLIAAGATS